MFQALHSEIWGWRGDKSRKSAIGDLWEMLDSKEKIRMPGSPTAQEERILGLGARAKSPHQAGGCCRPGSGDQRLRIPHQEPSRTGTFQPLSRIPR